MAGIVEGGGGVPPDRVQHGQGRGTGTYANIAGNQVLGRKKLNVLDIMLERKDNSISYNLSKEELSKLLFKKMKLDPKSTMKIDTAGFGKIHVELKNEVNLETFLSLPAFDIRDGLRTRYYKPHHRKETLVTLSWMDIETPDDLLVHVLNYFGNVKSNVKWTTIKEEEGESEIAKLLNNIQNGERQVWLEVTKPLPSYAMIDRRKVKIYHPGQRRTCARCQKVADLCKGNSNARLCEDNGGEKVNVADAWKDILKSVNYVEWIGEEDKKEEKTDEKADEIVVDDDGVDENEADITNCDGIVISNLEEDATLEDIKLILEKTVPDDDIAKITFHPTGSTRSKIVKNIDISLVRRIAKKVDNKSFKGRLLHCRPHVPVSPPKLKPVPADPDEPTPSEIKATTNEVEPTPTKVNEAKTENPSVPEKENPLSTIPGLPQKDIERANRKQENKKKKEERKQKKEEKDALLNSTSITDNLSEQFEFKDDSDEDTFEDSVEDVKEMMTPKPFKSNFAKKVEATLTPNITPKRAASFANLSPIEPTDSKKSKPIKPARKSSLPRVPRKN